MNISQLMQTFLGQARMSEGNVLELKPGDVVRGTVVRIVSQEQALLNINGHMILAKLETPLNPGQATMLQVQPESTQGLIVMKPLGSSTVPMTHESLSELLKMYGLRNQPLERHLLQMMHQQGVAINSQHISALTPLLAGIPHDVPSEQWLRAALLALQRALPLNHQTVHALQQLMFGPPVSELIKQLQVQIQPFISAPASTTSSNPSNEGNQSQTVAGTSLASGAAAAMNIDSRGVATSAHGVTSSGQSMASDNSALSRIANSMNSLGHDTMSGSAIVNGRAVTDSAIVSGGSITNNGVLVDNGNRIPLSAVSSSVPSTVLLAQLAPYLNQLLSEVSGQFVGQSELPTNHQAQNTEGLQGQQSFQQSGVLQNQSSAVANALMNHGAVNASEINIANQQSADQSSARVQVREERVQTDMQQAGAVHHDPASHVGMSGRTAPQGNWISNILKLLGIDHEQRVVQFMNEATNEQRFTIEASRSMPLDNIKSLLLQLNQASDLPQGLRESVQQLLHHITGQQLLLSADRASPFTHVTLFLPLYDQHGEQTAAINIQSRKGKKGGIDPENCRLVFDLSMAHLGQTLIDVVVMNQIVSVQVYNNHPQITQWLTDGREMMSEALLQLGYQLSSLTAKPLSEGHEAEQQGETVRGEEVFETMFQTRPYKGMDVRI